MMKDVDTTSKQPTNEGELLHLQIAQLETSEAEHKRAEEAYQTIIRTAMDGFWLLDMEGHFLDVNEAYCRLVGYSRDELLNMAITDIEAIEKPGDTAEHIRTIKEVGYDRFETHHRCKDGKIADIEISVNYLPTDGGRMFVFLRDVTERKRVEEELRLRSELLDSATDSIFVHDFEGNFIYVNETACKVHGYSREEFMKLKLQDIVVPERVGRLKSDFQEMLEKGRIIIESLHRRKDGSVILVEVHSGTIESGGRKLLLTVSRDITERKRVEEALRDSQERYRALFEQAADSIVLIDPDTLAVLEFNDRAYENLGYSREEFAKLKISDYDVSESAEEVARHLDKIVKEGADAFETKQRAKSGEVRDIQVSARAIHIGGRNLIQSIRRDITERKKADAEIKKYSENLEKMVEERTKELRDAQEDLVRSEQLATLGQFSGSISHELRNPLGVIDSSIYYLKTKLRDADTKVQEHLDRIKSSVGSATAIIQSLLDLTRMKEPQLAKLDLISVVSDVIATSEVPATVEVIQDFADKQILVKADGEQLRMAFKNIISNALDAMDDKGVLTVRVGTTAGGQAEVSFADTGSGIAPENLSKVFQPLFSTKAKGIGFGLSITNMIVDRHGGMIEARSEAGKGATLIIQLPPYTDKTKEVKKCLKG
jgi:PAS domain S-box-containing protein